MQAASVQHVPEFQAPREKASVQHKLFGLYKHFTDSESPFSSDGGGGELQNPKPPGTS